MDKLNQNARDRLHFLWFITVVVCVMITYHYQKSKAADNYQKVLQVAAKNCGLEEVKFLVQNIVPDLGGITLHHAAEEGCLEIVKFLLEKGADINAINGALLDAAGGGQLEVVKLLLQNGANPHHEDWKRRTAKIMAIKMSLYPINRNSKKPYNEIIDLLRDAEKRYESKQ